MFGMYWEQLVEDMLATGEFDLSRLSHVFMRQTHYANRSLVLPETVRYVPCAPIYAHVARLKTGNPAWQELAWFYVGQGHEGNGIMRDLALELVNATPVGTAFFGITKRKPVMRVFARLGLAPVTRSVIDVQAWADDNGVPRYRLPETAGSASEPDPKEGERWLFIQR